jgi:hypothetical protein
MALKERAAMKATDAVRRSDAAMAKPFAPPSASDPKKLKL